MAPATSESTPGAWSVWTISVFVVIFIGRIELGRKRGRPPGRAGGRRRPSYWCSPLGAVAGKSSST